MGDYLTEVTIVTKVTKPTKVVTRVVSFTTDYSGIIPFIATSYNNNTIDIYLVDCIIYSGLFTLFVEYI